MVRDLTHRAIQRVAAATCIAAAITCVGEASAKISDEQTPALSDQSLGSSVGLPSNAAVFRASKDATEATAQAAVGGDLSDSFHLIGFVKATTPVTKTTTTATLATLEGLSNATTAEIGLTPIYWKIEASSVAAAAVCKKYNVDPCQESSFPTPEAREEYVRAAHPKDSNPWFGRLSFQIGRQDFSYFKDGTTKSTEKRTPFAINASFGTFIPSFGYIGLAYRREVAFEEGSKTTICVPYGTVAGNTRCDSATIGAPTKSSKNIVRAEARWWTGSGKIALNPIVSYDIDNRVLGIQAPIYFLAGSNSMLVGGVNPGWRSDTKELTGAVFVGAALGTAPGL